MFLIADKFAERFFPFAFAFHFRLTLHCASSVFQTFKLYRQITTFEASKNFIEHLPTNTPSSLVNLDLSYNDLTSLQNFDHLLSLKKLNVSHNSISTASGLSNLTSLVSLDISNNKIRVVEGVERCRKLEVVSFANNRLKSYYDVRALSLNRKLKVANLEGNDVTRYSNFKFKIIHLLPGVSVIGRLSKTVEIAPVLGKDDAMALSIGLKGQPPVQEKRTTRVHSSPPAHPHQAQSQHVGKGTGSGITQLVTQRNKTHHHQKKLSDEVEKNGTKPLPWRQPPAPIPHMTRHVSNKLDDAYSQSQESRKKKRGEAIAAEQENHHNNSQNQNNFNIPAHQRHLKHHNAIESSEVPKNVYGGIGEQGIWWTPSRLNQEPKFEPEPNRGDTVNHSYIKRMNNAKGGGRWRWEEGAERKCWWKWRSKWRWKRRVRKQTPTELCQKKLCKGEHNRQ